MVSNVKHKGRKKKKTVVEPERTDAIVKDDNSDRVGKVSTKKSSSNHEFNNSNNRSEMVIIEMFEPVIKIDLHTNMY